jgi:hypothetical protein
MAFNPTSSQIKWNRNPRRNPMMRIPVVVCGLNWYMAHARAGANMAPTTLASIKTL